MPYHVIKKINGCHYLYSQETYREGGKVRTWSQYIGPVDPGRAARLKAVGEPMDGALIETEAEISYTVEIMDPPHTAEANTLPKAYETPKTASHPSRTGKSSQVPNKTLKKAKPELNTTKRGEYKDQKQKSKGRPALRIKASVERHHISRTALEAEHKRFTRLMEALGLKTDGIGRVLVGVGRKVAAKRRRSGNYIITIPRWKITKARGERGPSTREAFKRAYRKALAGTYLDAIKAQDPDYYAGLEQNLTCSFRTQNKAIEGYIMNSGWKLTQKVGLTLHFMHSKMLSDWTKAKVASEKLGLADHERRDNWRQDAESLMAELQQHGWSQCYSKYMTELAKAESFALRKLGQYQDAPLMDRLSGKRRKYAREFRKLNARRKAIHAACDKISVLAPLFQSYGDKRFDRRSAFMHEGNWERRKARRARRRVSRA